MKTLISKEELIGAANRLSLFPRTTVLQLDSRLAYAVRLDVLGARLLNQITGEVDGKAFSAMELEDLFDKVLASGTTVATEKRAETILKEVEDGQTPEQLEQAPDPQAALLKSRWCERLPASQIEPSVPRAHHKMVTTDEFIAGGLGGAVVLLGRTGAGKSEYIEQHHSEAIVLRYGEPYERFDVGNNAVQIESVSHLIGAGMILAASGKLAFWDSVSNLMYNLTGSALPGGAIATAVTSLTGINNLIARLGGIAAISVNVMLAEDAVQNFAEEMAGRLSGLILVRGGAPIYKTFRTTQARYFSFGSDDQQAVRSADVRMIPVPALNEQDSLSEASVFGVRSATDDGDTPVERRVGAVFNLNNDM